jgi:phenylpropionate dioxygenase-like ring-hydroxylating dioxygenase large terminal subunit
VTRPIQAAFAGVSVDVASARALPRAAYAERDVFEAELDQVFRRGWLPVARVSEVAKPGDYRSVDPCGVPLVVTRDGAGAIHVLSRVCRHRGMPIVEGAGNAESLTCPYHRWRYRLDGRLAAASAMERSEAFDQASCALPPIAAAAWRGWVFANLDGRAAPLAPQLAALDDRLAELDPSRMVTAGVIEFDSPWNWKVMVENFLESYHHIGPHSQTLQLSNPGLGTYEGGGGDLYTILENPPIDGEHAHLLVAAVFPLTLMAFTEGPEPLGVWYEFDRIEHQSFKLRIHLLTSEAFAAVPAFVARYRDAVTAVHLEDIPACEGVQRGVLSPLYEPGPLSHLEAAAWRFHRFLRRQLIRPGLGH